MRIQGGDVRLRNEFITDYQPYVAKMTSRFCKRYIDPAKDDEFSIALGAFNEAISQFSAESGRSFLSFAETVVRRRLIDYVRKEQRFTGQIPLSSFDVQDEEDNIINPVENQQAALVYDSERLIEQRQAEIADFNDCLKQFGMTFSELAEISPKHVDSRQALFAIGYILSSDAELMRILIGKKMLPIKELMQQVDVSRKTLERNRKFIIAIALIHSGPYPCLKEYLQIPSLPRKEA
ncbi:RNA polymerase sigma factor SigI [Paenibacillus sp. y28]|uniref:RNA polymerase sigma factor SigI n=1 Tax=Paenibacillus sp. y28 TaxID=3129110 RepID=UPI00301ADBE6